MKPNTNMKVEVRGRKLFIEIDLQVPTLSASGKTWVIASSYGNIETDALFNGDKVTVGMNAYIRKPKRANRSEF